VLDPAELEREMTAALEDPAGALLAVELGDELAGYVKIEPSGAERFEIGIALMTGSRARGIGALAISEAAEQWLADRPSSALDALIRPENAASVRAFSAAGFEPAGQSGEFLVYRRAGPDRRSLGWVVAVVQARVGSTRFPGKVLAEIHGATLLERLLRRLVRSERVDAVAVATSTEPADDAIEQEAVRAGFRVVRGPLVDVLERYRLAAEALGADTIVRVTGDCPLVDPGVVDLVVGRFAAVAAGYVSNVHPPTFPDGLDVEVVRRDALDQAAASATEPDDREHVTRYLASRPERFAHANVESPVDLSGMRWTVDHPDDLDFVRAVFGRFPGREDSFSYGDVLVELEADPALEALMSAHPRNEKLAPGAHPEKA
jgi:spore coat polysaccharide biosynthesis protein SpsF